MTDPNPNYVPVDWPDNEDRIVGAKPSYDDSNCTMSCHANLSPCQHELEQERAATEAQLSAAIPENSDPARETSTLNSAGEPIKVGDRVHHLADAGQDERDTGTVRYVGPVTIAGTVVENGAGVQWDGNEHQTSHHVDLLTVLL